MEEEGLYASGYAHTMGLRGKWSRESKSGELIVARAADEAAAIYGPDLWAARIYHRGHTHTRVRASVPLPLPCAFLSFPLFRSETRSGGREDDVTAPRRWWYWVADNGNEPRKGERVCAQGRKIENKEGRRKREGDEGQGGR